MHDFGEGNSGTISSKDYMLGHLPSPKRVEADHGRLFRGDRRGSSRRENAK